MMNMLCTAILKKKRIYFASFWIVKKKWYMRAKDLWKYIKENTGYAINIECFGSVENFKKEGCVILEFDDFDWSE